MSHRFFSAAPLAGERAALAGAEAHHVAHVLRAQQGETVTLFDGSGAEFDARIERIGKSGVELTLIERREIDRELPFTLMLAVALPKGERQRWLIEKAVEFGVTRLIPLVTARSVPVAAAAIERLRRAVIEGSKQCGRNRLMEIASPQRWEEFCHAKVGEKAVRWVGHLDAREPPRIVSSEPPSEVLIAIGPEGDWTAEESALAREAGWRSVWLGPRVLRVESAAIALAVIATQEQWALLGPR